MAQPTYTSLTSYKDFSGIDLGIELAGTNTDNPSDVVDIFLERIENWCLSYLEYNFNVKPGDTEFNQDRFVKGLLYQIDYMRVNGDLSIRAVNNMRLLSRNTFTEWKLGGMCNVAVPMQREGFEWV